MTIQEYISNAKEIIEEHELQKYQDLLLDYWENNPPTMGHGFMHVLMVAVRAYEFSLLNKYPEPEHLFLGGLFHDVHREAEGRDGDESQMLSAKILNDLFNGGDAKVPHEIAYKIISAVNSHDSWRNEDNAPLFDLILSTADKACWKESVYPYVWASNKNTFETSGKKTFETHLRMLYGLVKYQQRAWEVMIKHPIKGTEEAITSYLAGFTLAAENYKRDGVDKALFSEYVENAAEEYRQNEIFSLKAFGRSEEQIKKLMARMH